MNKFRGIGVQLAVSFLIAILVPTLVLGIVVNNTVEDTQKRNVMMTSAQTLQETQKGFTNYLKTLSQPVDLLSRKEEVKHLEDKGDFDSNVTTIQDSLIASTKVTSGAVKAFFTTNTGARILGWTETDASTGKTVSKKSLDMGVDDTGREWYKLCIGAQARNGIYATFTKPYTDSTSGEKVITVSQEIKHTDKSNYGVVGMDIKFSEIEEYIQSISLLNTGYVLLVDENGNILVNRDDNEFTSIGNYDSWKKSLELEDGEVGSYVEKFGGHSNSITIIRDSVTGWSLVGVVGNDEITSVTNKVLNVTLMSAVIAIIVGALIAVFVTFMFTKEFKKINKVMNAVAEGDFSQRIPTKKRDEFGVLENSFNNMVDNVAGLIKNVEERSNVIIKASENISEISKTTTETTSQVSEAIQSVSIGASGQADSTNSASREVEKLAERLQETKSYVGDINTMSSDTQKLSNEGLAIVDTLISKGQKSIDNSKLSKDVVSEMITSIDKINFISNAITEITEETNMLSLNASIEAARAGESGRGFAVVADQIRKLAEQSQASTDEIVKIVNEISEKSALVEKTLNESDEIVKEQNKSIEDAKELFNTISESIDALTEGLRNIEQLNEQMDQSREVVVARMEDVASVSSETAAASEEVTASAEEVNATMQNLNQCTIELDEIASSLKEAIEQFKL